MKHDFLDKHSHIDSPVHSLDPRIKIITALTAIIIIASEPFDGNLIRLLLYSATITSAASLSRVPPKYILKRVLIVLPFIVMAALFYPLSVYYSYNESHMAERELLAGAGLTILVKSLLAVIILVILTSTERFHLLLYAMRRLRVPVVITTISALLYRYIFVLSDEALRTTRARQSRTPGRIMMPKTGVYGNQVAVIFLRSWERSQIIYKSMLSRGFQGEFPDMESLRISRAGIVLPVLFLALLLSARILI